MTKILEFPDCPYRFTLTPHDSIVGKSQHTHCLIEAQDGPFMRTVGAFIFNYHHGLDAIIKPFQIGEDWYITYSTSYTKIAVARLTDKFEHIDSDIGGEGGFCPTEVVIPFKLSWRDEKHDRTEVEYRWALPKNDPDYDFEYETGYADFGFYAGCVWGDDHTMKLRYLDFSKLATERKLQVSAPFGYHELPRVGKLIDHINLEHLDEDVLYLSRHEAYSKRDDGTWRDYSTRSQQQPRADLLRSLALQFLGPQQGHAWLYQPHSELNGMRPDGATCTFEGTVLAIKALFADKDKPTTT